MLLALHTSKKISNDGKSYVNKVLRSETRKYTAIQLDLYKEQNTCQQLITYHSLIIVLISLDISLVHE